MLIGFHLYIWLPPIKDSHMSYYYSQALSPNRVCRLLSEVLHDTQKELCIEQDTQEFRIDNPFPCRPLALKSD